MPPPGLVPGPPGQGCGSPGLVSHQGQHPGNPKALTLVTGSLGPWLAFLQSVMGTNGPTLGAQV